MWCIDEHKNYIDIGGNEIGEAVRLNGAGGYLSENNKFTFPSDGYIELYTSKTGSGGCGVRVYGSNDWTGVSVSRFMYQDSKHAVLSDVFFVRAGMKAWCTGTNTATGVNVMYVPLQG